MYMAAPGEHALVSGGVPVPGDAFKPWSDGPPGVLRADLSALGVTKELLGGMQTAKMACVGDCQHDKSELFLDGEAMTLARSIRFVVKAHVRPRRGKRERSSG